MNTTDHERKVPVSVVIPAYNAGRFIAETIDSVLSQTCRPTEVIIVDDGSTDDTCQQCEPYQDRVAYVRQANQGVAAARNHGVRRATNEFVAFLDADDIWHPRKLELQCAALAARPTLGLLGTGTFDWPQGAVPCCDGMQVQVELVSWPSLVVRNYFTTSSMLVRRELLERVGGFDPQLQGPEDYDLWLRLTEAAEAGNLELPLTGYRMVAGSLGKQAKSMHAGMRLILDKLDARIDWQAHQGLRRKAHGYCDYSCAYMYRAARYRKRALLLLLRSLCLYPQAFASGEVCTPFARPKMFGAIFLDKLGESSPVVRSLLPLARRGSSA